MFNNTKFDISTFNFNSLKKNELFSSAAFFDVDNTLIQGACIFYIAKKMYREDIFKIKDVIWFTWKHLKFTILGESITDIQSIKKSALAFFKGLLVEDTKNISEEIYDEILYSRIWTEAENLTKFHIKAGRKVWLVTASPIEIAEVISKRLNLTGALGTVGEVVKGRYTGRLVGDILHGPAKASAVLKLAKQQNLNLKTSFAYSDSYNDIPLLSLVGNPVAINPDRRLKKHALNSNWLIHHFR